MALIYWFEFTDVKGIVHRCNINKSDFVGDATEINGSLSLNKSSTKDTLDPIRGTGLDIVLEANESLTFNDFYTENERVYDVEYIRNGISIFKGWLSPEGIFEDFVSETWQLTLNCTGGLGFLENLSYVQNDTGLNFVGKQSMLEVIVNCLKRTNLDLNIYTYTDVVYDGQTGGTDTFAEAYINANRFIKEDEDTIMNCDEVLRSVLDLFGCCITMYNSSWVIYKPNTLHDSTDVDYYAYDSDGNPLTPTKLNINNSFTLGSQINDFYPHHINSNQRITIDSSIGAYRINYKYGLVKSLFNNLFLENVNGIVDEWTINDNTKLNFPSSNKGFLLETVQTTPRFLIITSDSFSINEGDVITFNYIGYTEIDSTSACSLQFKVILTDGVDTYYLDNDGFWKNSSTFISQTVTNVKVNTLIESNLAPISGDVNIEIYTPIRVVNFSDAIVFIEQCSLIPSGENITNIKGENHTFQVIDKPSTKIEDVKEIFNGDNPSDIYVGTIYKSDLTTPTEVWNRGNVRDISILRYSGEERMAMYSKPLRVFSGDIFGFVDFFNVISIDGINNVLFMPIEYNYDALNNITTVKLKQILNDAGGISYSNIDYNVTFDYGNTVEPTIKG